MVKLCCEQGSGTAHDKAQAKKEAMVANQKAKKAEQVQSALELQLSQMKQQLHDQRIDQLSQLEVMETFRSMLFNGRGYYFG